MAYDQIMWYGSLEEVITMKRTKRFICKVVANIAKSIAVLNTNSTCVYYAYQPELPEAVKKLRKNK